MNAKCVFEQRKDSGLHLRIDLLGHDQLVDVDFEEPVALGQRVEAAQLGEHAGHCSIASVPAQGNATIKENQTSDILSGFWSKWMRVRSRQGVQVAFPGVGSMDCTLITGSS